MRTFRTYLLPISLIAAGLASLGLFFFLPIPAPQTSTPQFISLWTSGSLVSIPATGVIPANWLAGASTRLFPGDRLLLSGSEVSPYQSLPLGGNVLQLVTGSRIALVENGHERVIYSSAPTLGEALWEAGIQINPADRLTPGLETPLAHPLSASLRRAVPLTIQQAGQELQLKSAAATVGEALADAGISLQGLDYTRPGESEPVPVSGRIQVIRVREQVVLEQKTIAFKSQYQADPNTELDQRSVLQPGITGLTVTRIRIKMEDGKEVSRQKEAEWTAREPKDQLVGYGTKVVIHTETVDGVTIQYWRKITAYATSYAPCEIYSDHCSYETASGMKLQKGVVALIRPWYYALKGSQVYVPGYGTGTVADIGGGVGGSNWIDLGYSDSDYVSWHSNVTVYFLAPAPANVSWALP